MLRVLSIFGTRPEAIKMAPVLTSLAQEPLIESRVCVTAQHRRMLDQVLTLFDVVPDFDLDLMEYHQSLASFTSRAMDSVTGVLREVKPDIVLVQGDTTTAMVAALAAFYQKVPVGHVEAGLRTANLLRPFPEEMNRRFIDMLAALCFAPTEAAAGALLREGVPPERILVTGNTVIDALHWVVGLPPSESARRLLEQVGLHNVLPKRPAGLEVDSDKASDGGSWATPDGARHILVTAHRRENFGEPIDNICKALIKIVRRNPGVKITYPVHSNPRVLQPVQCALGNARNIHLVDPIDYEPFVHLMARSYLVMTDSGGIQEEAPSLGVPVIVLRDETERPEAVEAGTVKVVGTDVEAIVSQAERLLRDQGEYLRMARSISPYGDGHSAKRIVDGLLRYETHGGARGRGP